MDFSIDEQNENWFDPLSPLGMVRRGVVQSAAGFLSEIIVTNDWDAAAIEGGALTFTDIAAASIKDLAGQPVLGIAESDGAGFSFSGDNRIPIDNRDSVAANEYVVYVGAFRFDSGSSANAKASWKDADARSAAGGAGLAFNSWGGQIYFNTAKNWYVGGNPGIDPTDNYGVQDSNKTPAQDVASDNWDWSTSSGSWKGFDLKTVDPTAQGKLDLYATSLHELIHALGATTSGIEAFVGVDASGDFVGPNLLQTYGGPVPGDGGHFAQDTQSLVWASDGIVSEAVLDPNSTSGVRKYLTDLDAALLRDLGYEVLSSFSTALQGDYNLDGIVDAADYTVWRDNLGGVFPAADGDGSGVVDQADYGVWLAAYGQAPTPRPALAIPAPSALALLLSVNWLLPARRGGPL